VPINLRGIDLTTPINRLASGFVALCQNVRRYLAGGFALRNPLSAAVISSLPTPIHTIRRLNDSTPNGPASGYSLVIGASTNLYIWNSTIGLVQVASGLSGNPLSMIPFRPNASVQPWMYVFDSSPMGAVTLITKYLISGDSVNFTSNGMMKVRSDGLCYKMGIEEPQTAPVVSTQNSVKTFSGTLQAKTIPWTNYSGANSGYNYGETDGLPNPTSPDGLTPFVVNCQNATSITITALSGTATINGGSHGPTDSSSSWAGSTFPAYFVQALGSGSHPPSTASVVVGAFTLGDDAYTTGGSTLVPMGVAPLFIPSVVDVGAAFAGSITIPVPYGAVSFQIGINSAGNSFNSNSGSFAIAGSVTTDALPTVTATIGEMTAYYWGDSPTSGPVGSYIWKNPDDSSGSGPIRSTSDAVGTTSGNSFIFDATFSAGIPGLPGVGNQTLPMEWTTLNPESVATGTNPVFAAPITTTYPTQTSFSNFNFCLTGNIYFPAAGQYSMVLTNHDDVIWGIGGGVTLVSASTSGSGEGGVATLSNYGQTITIVGGYPLLPREKYTSGEDGDYAQTTVVISVPAAGIYPIELDSDYWYHAGRILLLMASPTPMASPTIIPPLPSGVREDTQYRYTYRSSATGAPSNPSPESSVEAVPVISNTITSIWSPDPQVDLVDYWRIDSATASFTYVNTGPNDNSGRGTNTPVSDSLSDTELGNQLLSYDNYEPFPSIDLPQKGTCNISGGVITWVSGGAIGGTATGFNVRWLAGTIIEIGSPTSLDYTLIARPSGNTIIIPGVPDGTSQQYVIEEPILAAQPLPYAWGPTDNINFVSAVGDQLRPGTHYWSEGSNLDSAPDTNQADVTDPSEPLVSGTISGGRQFLASIKRAWLIMPNFFNALATVTGTEGSTWSYEETGARRGLYMPRCFAVEGGGLIFERVADGIDLIESGGASQSITDGTLYPLFPHEGSVPAPVVRNGVTIYPPDDTQPQLQQFSISNGYLYYDYAASGGARYTLAFDILARAWVPDSYSTAATIHAPDEGQSQQGTLVGCADGTVRTLSSGGTETVTGTVLTAAIGGKGYGHIGMMCIEYTAAAAVALTFLAADADNGSYAPGEVTLPATGSEPTKYWFRPSAAKFKWVQAQFQTTDQKFNLYMDGCVALAKSWGDTGPYRPVQLFAPNGGEA
jgi:hypothetical protein